MPAKKSCPTKPRKLSYARVHYLEQKLSGLMGSTFRLAMEYGIAPEYGPFADDLHNYAEVPEHLLRFWAALSDAKEHLHKAHHCAFDGDRKLREEQKQSAKKSGAKP